MPPAQQFPVAIYIISDFFDFVNSFSKKFLSLENIFILTDEKIYFTTRKEVLKCKEQKPKSTELKLFEVKERTISNPDGTIRVTKTTKVTGKGQTYFINKFLQGKSEE